MAREEEIINAGIDYTLQTYPVCLGGDNFSEQMRDFNRNRSFEAGAKWSDEHPKNIWHPINDIPTRPYEIICKDDKEKCRYYDWKYIYDNYPDWKEFVETMNVKKWIYIHEL